MNNLLLFFAIVLILCVFVYKFLSRFGIPMLLIFISLGMIFGENGIFKIYFNNFELSRDICTLALIFIIFFGGFGTKLSMARPVLKRALSLSTLGVFFTAILTAVFSYYILKLSWQTSLLIGSVLSSTDAASVFAILRTHKLGLKENTASLLEIESGSNDPFAYVLTVSFLSMTRIGINFPILLFKQVIFALLIGYTVAKLTMFLLKRIRNLDIGFTMAFLMGATLLTYTFTEYLGGNGYIAIYLLGILVGNTSFKGKSEIVSFFNGVTSIMQMLIFFLLGLLVSPTIAFKYIIPSTILMLALTFLIRPLVIFSLMSFFKASKGQMLLTSWAGLRGAASVVFSILVIVAHREVGDIVFNISFVVVLLSIAIQGSLLPYVSKKLNMIDEEGNVLKTFNDYSDEEDVNFISFEIDKTHKWIGKAIKNIELMPGVLLVLIVRNNTNIIPSGSTTIENGDKIVLCGSTFQEKHSRIHLYEKIIDKDSDLKEKAIYELGKKLFVVMIKRGEKAMIPHGNTVILENDILVLADR
ncbi:MAG: potassium/proton antiporter [Fusobacterium sp.]|uniref:potassium/proton antiporter n=1 Tax=Fusobacterium sp. TaxID=68766 RepID=UPI0026DBF033|nr:potassium/proton antiporter [Fusobacterium sp.]MDO4689909.1 potassium/proton antiporter [Fusobacterium sp.]